MSGVAGRPWARHTDGHVKRTLHAFAALLAVLLGMFEGVAALADQARTHVVCPEHGELIEAVHVPGVAHETLANATPDRHDMGCALALFGHPPPVAELPTPPSLLLPPIPDPECPVLGAAAGVARAPLLTAPKTSPPTA